MKQIPFKQKNISLADCHDLLAAFREKTAVFGTACLEVYPSTMTSTFGVRPRQQITYRRSDIHLQNINNK